MAGDLPTTTWGTALAAVLFDMDGTLVDTEPHWRAADRRVATEYGTGWDEARGGDLVGVSLDFESAYLREHCDVQLDEAQIQRLLVDQVIDTMRRGIDWLAGAYDLLLESREAPVATALVTSAPRAVTEVVLGDIPDGSFDAVVAADDVAAGKPDPEAYRLAARRLGVDPSSCLAIEDSPSGIQSAYAAGCHVVIVGSHDTAERAGQNAGNTVATLAGTRLGELVTIARPAR